MSAWWDSLTVLERILACIAVPATLVLILQTILSLVGLGGEHDMETDADHDIDHDIDSDTDHDVSHEIDHDGHEQGYEHSEAGLKLFTLRGIIAFLAVYGWGALAVSRSGHPWFTAMGIGFILGLAAMLLVAAVLKLFITLQSNGAINLENAVGLDGTVYLTIPAGGQGKVSIILQERFSEFDAVSQNGETLKTGTEVTVIGLTEDNRLIVKSKQQAQPL
ncbi:MAG: hypothetical protein GX942_01230 [Papillibacter sp.]|jgi:hypothetical protein|nr:hypothetical protein [Papillibacter sp.]